MQLLATAQRIGIAPMQVVFLADHVGSINFTMSKRSRIVLAQRQLVNVDFVVRVQLFHNVSAILLHKFDRILLVFVVSVLWLVSVSF